VCWPVNASNKQERENEESTYYGLIYGIVKHDSLMGIAGAMLLLMGLSNTGCGAAGGCGVPPSRKNAGKDIEFEEIGR
jgi:hypothetical protein